MLKLKELHLTNFRSWKELDLTDLDKKGLCLIHAGNGKGKSSLRQAIEYLLLDDTSDSLPLDELPFNSDTECTLNCIIDKDGSIIEITKYRNHRGSDGNKSLLKIDGDESLSSTDRRETQKNIEEVLGINKNSMLMSTIFSQFSPSFLEAKEKDRKDILYSYDFLGLDKYKKYNALAKIMLSCAEDDIKNKFNSIDNLEDKTKSLVIEILDFEAKSNNFENEKKSRIKSLIGSKELINKKSFSELEEQIEKLTGKFLPEEFETTIKSINLVGEDLSAKKSSLLLKIRNIESILNSVDNSTCPILKESCSKLEERRIETHEEFDSRLNLLSRELSIVKSKYEENDNLLKSIINKKEKNLLIKEEINTIKHNIELIKKDNDNIEDRIKDIDKRILEITDSKNPYIELIERNRLNINTCNKQISDFRAEIMELNDYTKYLSFWKDGFSPKGIPNLKIELLLSELENSVNTYLSKISDKMYVQINAQSELKSSKELKEKISYTIHHTDKSIKDYNSYSGGEKQRVKVSDLLAFSDMLGKFNFIIMDEVLELSLDESGKEDVFTLLRDKAKNLGSLFVISHSDQIKDKFDNVINIEKKDGASYVQ